jgi:hypothetical protein
MRALRVCTDTKAAAPASANALSGWLRSSGKGLMTNAFRTCKANFSAGTSAAHDLHAESVAQGRSMVVELTVSHLRLSPRASLCSTKLSADVVSRCGHTGGHRLLRRRSVSDPNGGLGALQCGDQIFGANCAISGPPSSQFRCRGPKGQSGNQAFDELPQGGLPARRRRHACARRPPSPLPTGSMPRCSQPRPFPT